MRKKLLSLAIATLVFSGNALAEDIYSDTIAHVTVADVELAPGQTIGAIMTTDIPYDKKVMATQFVINLPAGLTPGWSYFDYPEIDPSTTNLVITGTGSNPITLEDGTIAYKALGAVAGRMPDSTQVFEHTGKFAYLTIKASEDMEPGVYTGKILQDFYWEKGEESDDYYYSMHGCKPVSNPTTGKSDITYYKWNPIEFQITVTDNRYVLDENSPVLPKDTANVNVRLNRTIKANRWNTLVLPFDLDAEQVAAAFGDGTMIAAFEGSSEDGNITSEQEGSSYTSVDVTFAADDAIYAGYPVLIKTTSEITSADIDGVTIDMTANNASLGSSKKLQLTMYGNYKANCIILDEAVSSNGSYYVLSNNKFYKAISTTSINGYRAYFGTNKPIVSPTEAKAITFNIIDKENATVIERVNINGETISDIYNLEGKLIRKNSTTEGLPGGIYIQNGKKIYVK